MLHPIALTGPPGGAYSLGGGPLSFVSYSELKNWLTADAASSAQIAAVRSLPASAASFPNAANMFVISPAEKKALGVFSGDGGAIDGSIGFNINDASSPEDWEPAALCEIAHALGWDSIAQGGSYPAVADLFRYSSPGHYQWTSGQPAYFSIDGGNTNLGDFSTSFDQTLFTDVPADDALRLPFTSAATTLTSLDIEALSVIGFGVTHVVSPRAAAPLQLRRDVFRHPVAEHRRSGRDLGDERRQHSRRGTDQPEPRAELDRDRNWRFQRRRPFRHPVAEHEHRPGLDLGDERDQCDRRRGRRLQPRAELDRDRDGRFQQGRAFRHPVAERQRSGLDLGDERDQRHRRRARRRPILGRPGKRSEPGTSTTTVIPTSCGGTRAAARSRSGK